MRTCKPGEIRRDALRSLHCQTFGSEPFDWQLDTAKGTGNGKTLAFTLALVLNKLDIAIVVLYLR